MSRNRGTPDRSLTIDQQNVRLIARWAAKRYHRSSLPTAFDSRITNVARKKIVKKLEADRADISYIFLGLNSTDELPLTEPYRIVLRALVPTDVAEDQCGEGTAVSVAAELRRQLGQCPGIEVVDADVVSEKEFTLDEWRHMILWENIEYLSAATKIADLRQGHRLENFRNPGLQTHNLVAYLTKLFRNVLSSKAVSPALTLM